MTKRRANNEGSIRERADGRFEVRITQGVDFATGQPKRLSRSAPTKAEAVKLLQKLSYQYATKPQSFQDMTLGNWLDLCLEVYMNNNLKQSTYNSYESYIRVHFKPALGDIQLRDLHPRMLQQFYNYKMEEEKLAPKTVINLNLFLHKALSHAMAEGLIQSNPAEAVSLSRGQKPQIDVLKREEQAALIRGSYQFRYGVFVRLVLFTGLRLGELLGLRWEDIDFTHNMLYVKRALNRLNKKKRPTDPNETTTEIVIQTPKSENSVRSIPLLPNLANELWQWKAVQARDRAQMGDAYVESGMIVTAPDGRYIEPRTFSDYYHQILQGCGLQHFTFHALRHTFATRALEQGMDSKTLSVLLGHYSVSFTLDTYAHVLDSQKIDSMGLMADLLNLPDTEIQPNAYSIIVSPKSDGSFYFSAPDFPSVTHVGIDYISGIQCMKDKLSEEILMSLIIPLPMPIEQIPMQAGDILVQVLI